jgi:hypothetical protein
MTELVEPVDIAFASDDPWNCPFSHAKKKPPPIDNVMPPVDGKEKNDSILLGKNLDGQNAGMEIIEIGLKIANKAKKFDVQYTPHHLIPGNETWPKTKLLDWVDESKGTINGDIGYDVNHAANGVDLPGVHGLSDGFWSASGQAFQSRYAFAAMACSAPKRQFHDRHNTYSRFVVNALDAVAAKIKPKGQTTPGCGDEKCGGSKKKPYDPPFGLVDRVNNIAGRLRTKLQGEEPTWEMPIFTSRFAVMFKTQPMTQERARELLREAREEME